MMSLGDPGERTSASERAYRALRSAILTGELTAGERLTGAKLTERLGVSRTPVRSALLRLEAEGLVQTEDGRSAWVRPLSATDVEQAYDVAEGLECVMVARLCSQASQQEIAQIAAATSEMESAAEAGDRHRWVKADELFHRLLVDFGRNPLIDSTMIRANNVIGRIRLVSLHLYPDGATRSSAEHRQVAEAIEKGLGREARDLHHDHWERVRETNVVLLRESFDAFGGFARTTEAPVR